jgi:hypothetical protein
MRTWLIGISTLVVGCTSPPADGLIDGPQAATSTDDVRHLVTLRLDDWAAQMKKLHGRGYDVAGVNLPDHRVDVLIGDPGLAALEADGFVVVAQRELQSMARSHEDAAERQYQTPASMEAKLRAFVAAHPNTTALTSIGKSVEGRDIWALEIARDPTKHSPAKPAVLFNGSQHAREVMSAEVPLDTIDALLSNDGVDPKVTRWIDESEIWVVPMVNVDGVNRVWTDDPGWRKNAHGCGTGRCPLGRGVDINRNFPYQWASCGGSSAVPAADDFHGASAASEPETQALMKLVDQIRPVVDISYHSFGEVVLYPYGCQGQYAPDRALVEETGHAIAAAIPTDDGTGTYLAGTPWEGVYPIDGDDMDWMADAYGTLGFVIELNGMDAGFEPAYEDWRDKTVAKVRPAWQLVLDRLSGSGVRGVVTENGAPATAARVTVSSGAGDAPPAQERPVNPDGSFHVVLRPGTYHVKVTARGRARPTFETDVMVADSRIDLEIPL